MDIINNLVEVVGASLANQNETIERLSNSMTALRKFAIKQVIFDGVIVYFGLKLCKLYESKGE